MSKSKTNNTKLGAFVLLALVMFTFGVYQVSGGYSWFNKPLTIYAEFDDASGLMQGNAVRYAGLAVGTVKKININGNQKVRVQMALDNEASQYIQNSAEVDIATNGLVGNMIINITAGEAKGAPIKDNDILTVRRSLNMTEVLGVLAETNDQIQKISTNLVEITDKINDGQGSLGMLLNDSKLADNLISTGKNLNHTTRSLKSTADSIQHILTDASNGKGNLGFIISDNSLRRTVDKLNHEIDTLMDNRISPILEDLQTASTNIVSSSEQIDTIISQAKNGDGLLNTMIHDTTIVNDIQSTLDNLNDGTHKFDESMEALQHHWLLRKFFKKKAKEKEKAAKKLKK